MQCVYSPDEAAAAVSAVFQPDVMSDNEAQSITLSLPHNDLIDRGMTSVVHPFIRPSIVHPSLRRSSVPPSFICPSVHHS